MNSIRKPFSSVITFYLIILLPLCIQCANRDEEILTMKNAPWGKEYQKYFKDLEKKGLLIRDKYDSSVYHGIINNDSITIVVNGLKWPSKKLLVIELFLGQCDGNKLYGGISDGTKFDFFDMSGDSTRYFSGYEYKTGTKESIALYNKCKELYASSYNSPKVDTVTSLFGANVYYQWVSDFGVIQNNNRSAISMIHSSFAIELHKVIDSLARTLKPKDIVSVICQSSPEIEFVDSKCSLRVSFSEVARLEYCIKEKIIGVQFDLVFKDDFDNDIFRIKNLQYEIPGGGLDNLIRGGTIVVPMTMFSIEGVYGHYQDEYKYLVKMKNDENYNLPKTIVTAVLFEGGRIVKE